MTVDKVQQQRVPRISSRIWAKAKWRKVPVLCRNSLGNWVTPCYKAIMETKYVNTDCPKLKTGVVLTLTRPHPTPEWTNHPFRLTNCDSALECGLIKEKDETPDWSMCPLYESRFWLWQLYPVPFLKWLWTILSPTRLWIFSISPASQYTNFSKKYTLRPIASRSLMFRLHAEEDTLPEGSFWAVGTPYLYPQPKAALNPPLKQKSFRICHYRRGRLCCGPGSR